MPENKNFKEVNKEVYYAIGNIIKLGKGDIQLFKEKAIHNKRQRSRLCTHKDINDKLHEMFIVHRKDTYIRPHKHLDKSESYHIIKGSAYIITFDEQGTMAELIKMGDYSSGHSFYCRVAGPYYHTLFITSDFLVFHEVTSGPFEKSDTLFAPWAPEEDDKSGIRKFMNKLKHSINGNLSYRQRKNQ